MAAVFRDLQDRSNPFEGSRVESCEDFAEIWNRAGNRPPFLCELEGDHGFMLTIGLGNNSGVVQHCATSHDPPYLFAVSRELVTEEPVDFLMGNQPCEVLALNVISRDTLLSIVEYFLSTGSRLPAVLWEEV
jgi:hypothetical protein